MANEISGVRATALQPAQARPVANALVQGQSQASSDRAAADTVTLTDSARLMQRLEAAVAQAPRVDPKRIDVIKQQIASGNYKVDASQVATQFAQLESDLAEPKHELVASRTENGYTYELTTQTARGTRERTVTVAYDEATGTLSRDITLTGANGEQISRHGELQRTEDGYMKSFSITGRDGETVSRQVEVSYDAESKSLTRVVTVDGQNHDYVRTTQLARSEDGELIHKTVVSPMDNGLT